MSVPIHTEELLLKLNRIGLALSSERNVDTLLDLILFEARQFTRAEAGSLYLREDDRLRFAVAQNDRLGNRQAQSTKGDTVRTMRDVTIPLTMTSLAGYVGSTGHILNLEDAYAIPTDRPYKFNRDFDVKSNFRTRSLMLVPMKDPDGSILGVVQLINALGDNGEVVSFNPALEPLVSSLASQAAVSVRNARLTAELRDSYYDTILRLSVAAEYRDTDTANHIHRMSHYAGVIARGVGLNPDDVEMLVHASPMHDIGKLGTPDAILLKPGKLTPEEFKIMQQHTVIGAKILSNSKAPILKLAEQIAITHHEKWDGTGYPLGVKGKDIPMVGRIAAVADVFDALTSKRCYKPAYSTEEAINLLRQGAGRHFDERLVEVFIRMLPEIVEIKKKYADPEPVAQSPPPAPPVNRPPEPPGSLSISYNPRR